ncbi:MAG TPA: hypothetical protein VMJ10_21030 [Kofleriaceae bacterium]|nr:hypothetical protein [Kofleriaceae bacterium]
MRALFAVLTIAACGHLGFDTGGGGGSAGVDAGGDGGDGGVGSAGRWAQVSTGSLWGCAIANDASLWCWGGLVMDPTGQRIYPPTQVTGSWKTVSVNSTYSGDGDHACGIQSDASLWCWGRNDNGALGDNTTNDEMAPIHIGNASWIAVAAGDQFTCGIQSDGSLWCWGGNGYGELGDNTTNDHHAPAKVGSATWIAVTAGDSYACGLQTGGAALCWGFNTYGELGDNTTTDRHVPTAVITPSSEPMSSYWTSIAASDTDDHTCATRSDGTAWCWGVNSSGELGDGTNNDSNFPAKVGVPLQQIAVGDDHTCGVDAANTLWCWGDSTYGQLGGTDITATPTNVGQAAAVSAAEDQTCFIGTAGSLACTGRNSLGQLGPGIAPGETHTPAQADTRTDWASITAGGTHACGLTSGGTAMCWGYNSEDELGDGTSIDRDVPAPMNNAVTLTAVSAGTSTTFGLTATGTALLWGCDWVADDNNATAETMAMSGWTAEVAAEEHTCGLIGTALWCRGDDSNGQIGDGNMSGTPANYQVAGAWSAVAVGGYTTCAINSSTAKVNCWGEGDSGQIGNNATNDTATPQAVLLAGGLGAPQQIAVGYDFACAITAPGALSCWGNNSCGELGDGTGTNQSSPVRAGSRTDWIEVSAGGSHVCGITANHALWCMGSGGEGAVADPGLQNALAPEQVGADLDWAHVAAGDDFTCAIKMDGTRWCFGTDDNGQLGNNLAWHAGFVEIP